MILLSRMRCARLYTWVRTMGDRVVEENLKIKIPSFVALYASAWDFLGCLGDFSFQGGVSSFLFHRCHGNALHTIYGGQG